MNTGDPEAQDSTTRGWRRHLTLATVRGAVAGAVHAALEWLWEAISS